MGPGSEPLTVVLTVTRKRDQAQGALLDELVTDLGPTAAVAAAQVAAEAAAAAVRDPPQNMDYLPAQCPKPPRVVVQRAPNHLGLCSQHGLSSKTMTLITSDCVAAR